jgi:hypothetical protein
MIANVPDKNPRCGRSIRRLLLTGCVALFCSAVANAGVGADESRYSGQRVMSDQGNKAINDSDRECETKFTTFIQELDKLLASDPSTIYPVFDLLNRSFPVEGCDIQGAIRVSRQSRFFSHVSEEITYYVIAFDSRGFAGPMDPGFHVQVSLLKASGNSRLPAAHVNQ